MICTKKNRVVPAFYNSQRVNVPAVTSIPVPQVGLLQQAIMIKDKVFL